MSNKGNGKPPRDRKHPQLWQAYLWWNEILTAKNRHITRIKHIEAGRSNMDAQIEWDIIEMMQYDAMLAYAQKEMASYGETVGPIWDWLIGLKGIGPHTAAKLLAQIDDIGRFATISKLRRFSGLAVIDGKAEPKDSEHYNRRLKAMLLGEQGVVDQFIRKNTYPYYDLYLEKKAEDRRKHPDVLCKQCGCKWEDCLRRDSHKRKYNDGHMHVRAMRKVAQVFLSHLWVTWRETEGLPVSKPYAEAILGHTNIIEPPALGQQWAGGL